MKRYLLFIISMFCVSIGAWAQDPTSGKFGASGNSDWTITGESPNQTLTLTFNNANDLPLKAVVYEWGTSWEAICSATSITKVVVNTGSGVTLSGGADSPLASLSDNYKSIPLLDLSEASINIVETYGGSGIYTIPMAGGDNSTFNNIIVPSSYSNGLNVLQVANRWNLGAYATLNTYQVSGNTISAVFKTDKSNYATLTDIKSDYVTLKLAADVTDAIDLSTVLPAGKTLDLTAVTTVATSSNDITVLSAANPKINVICLIDGVKSRVKPVESCNYPDVSTVITGTISEITTRVEELASYGLCLEEANVTGVLSTADLTDLGTINGLKRLNLQEATLATGVELNSLDIPSTLEELVLPKTGAGETTTPEASIDATLLEKIKERNSLKYVYAPYSGTQNASQMVADYVWVNKPGGLAKAFDEQAGLRNAWYMIVESTVALNNDDVNFWGSDPENARVMQYRYLDLSGANITTAVAANYRVTDQEAYRIILPNDWTGDMMNVFANIPKANRGSIAAVYSYTGTDHKRLDILEIDDYAYLSTALHDARIVREGTEEVRVISGPNYSKFGTKLLTALNSADDTPNDPETNHITSVTIAVGDGIYTSTTDADTKVASATKFVFTNPHLTKLTMNYINNQYVTIDVSGCTALEELYLNETTLAGVIAAGAGDDDSNPATPDKTLPLSTVSLGHAIIGGDVDLSYTDLGTLLEVDQANITGTLNVSNTQASSFDFSQLTAMSVNASNIEDLKDLNLNGITLSGMTEPDAITPANISAKVGTVEVTRSSADYSNLQITLAESAKFDINRIIPNREDAGDSWNECHNAHEAAHAAWETRFGTWLYENKTTYLSNERESSIENAYDDDPNLATEYGSKDKYVEYRMLQGEVGLPPMTWEQNFGDWLYNNRDNYLSETAENALKAEYNDLSDKSDYTDEADYVKKNMQNALDKPNDGDLEANLAAAKEAYGVYVQNENNTLFGYEPYVIFNMAKATYGTEEADEEPTENCTSKGYSTVTIVEAKMEITIAGSSLQTNMSGIIIDTDDDNVADASATPDDVEILHVTGMLSAADLNYITNMKGLQTLDLSNCTYATGVTHTTVLNAGLNKTTAIILPNTSENTDESDIEQDMKSAVKAFQDASYECVGYYTKNTAEHKRLNVYGYNGTVAKLKTGNLSKQTGVTQPTVVDNNTDITFLPKYGNTDAENSYPQATPMLMTAFSEFGTNTYTAYPYSVDMTWLDISNLGTDFSKVKCHYLVIPQNTWAAETTRSNGITYNNDFTVTTGSEPVPYIYNSEVRAVSTYKGTAMPYATSAYFGGRGMQFDVYNLNETANLTYLISEGSLDDVRTHMSSLLQNANVIMIKGTLNSSDCTGLNSLSNKRIDLTRVALDNDGADDDDFNWANFDNDNVEYLALPDGQNAVINATSVDEFAFNNCAALKAVGAYDPTNTKYTVHSTAKTVIWTDAPANTEFSDQENSVFEITKMCAPNASRQAGSALGTTNIVMSGYLTLSDIQNNGSDAQAGLNTNSTGAVVTADFSNAVFLNNEDMTFTGATWNNNALTSIQLPTDERQKRIPARSLYNYAVLTDICIPYNYETIGTAAFYLANLGHITTTDANGALVDNGAHTFTFSKNLKEIGDAPSPLMTGTGNAAYPTPLAEPVFFSYGYHDLTDIYVLRTGYEDGDTFNPTKCYRNAFGAGPTYGWGGFDGGSIYCREKYMNGSQLYTVLHFPDLASVNDETKYDNVKKAYTDPTRVYTKKDQTGAVDANGESPQWPTHSELGRAYNEAIRGLIWNDWTYTDTNQKAGNIEGGTITTPPGNPANVSLIATPTKFNINYTGWHEFVLALATYVAPDEKVEDNKVIRTYEEDEWYTFCIPFDMTEQEVALLLGIPRSTDEDSDTDIKIVNNLKTSDSKVSKVTKNIMPTIVTLKQVTRNSSTNTVSLSCSLDMGSGANQFKYYDPSTGIYTPNGYVDLDGDSNNEDDEKIMIRAGYPYIIRPYTLCDPETGVRNAVPSNNLGKQILTRYAFKMIASAINHSDTREAIGGEITKETSDFAKPYEGHKVQAYSDAEPMAPLYRDAPTNKKPYNYTFVGQYWTQYLPQNCFYMSGHKWYHNTYPREEGYYWYPYTCLILTSDEDDTANHLFRYDTDNTKYGETNYAYTIIPEEIGKDSKNHAVFDKVMQIRFKDGFDDSFTSNARLYHFVFDEDIMDFDEDGQTTGIEVLDGQHVAPVRGEVYNMAGQHVGNSLNGLPKGMYIVNGKKIVIR